MFKKKSYGQQMTFRELFKEGDVATKLSFVVMGAANLANKQYLKGLIFLFSQIAFFYWLIRNGLRALAMLATLGTQEQGLVFDERLGIEVLQEGDNSMLLLLFGIAAIVICVLLVGLYIINLKSARHIHELKQAGKKIPSTMDDLAKSAERTLLRYLDDDSVVGRTAVHGPAVALHDFDRLHEL